MLFCISFFVRLIGLFGLLLARTTGGRFVHGRDIDNRNISQIEIYKQNVKKTNILINCD